MYYVPAVYFAFKAYKEFKAMMTGVPDPAARNGGYSPIGGKRLIL